MVGTVLPYGPYTRARVYVEMEEPFQVFQIEFCSSLEKEMTERIEAHLATLNRCVFDLQEIGQSMAEQAKSPEEIAELLRVVARRLTALAEGAAR